MTGTTTRTASKQLALGFWPFSQNKGESLICCLLKCLLPKLRFLIGKKCPWSLNCPSESLGRLIFCGSKGQIAASCSWSIDFCSLMVTFISWLALKKGFDCLIQFWSLSWTLHGTCRWLPLVEQTVSSWDDSFQHVPRFWIDFLLQQLPAMPSQMSEIGFYCALQYRCVFTYTIHCKQSSCLFGLRRVQVLASSHGRSPFKQYSIASLPSNGRMTHLLFSQRLQLATAYSWIIPAYGAH